jgi:lipoate-protein ligase B
LHIDCEALCYSLIEVIKIDGCAVQKKTGYGEKLEKFTREAITTDNKQSTADTKTCDCVHLGRIDYNKAWILQSKLVSARVDKTITRDIILILEHPAVFTLGRRGGLDSLLVSEAFLKRSGIPVVQVERGGYITYHGPGQLIVYPIINLQARRISVKEFVEAMEEVMLRTVAAWGISANRNPMNRGIWIGNKKMGSIGIALRKGISFHGLALNVNLELTPFTWIQPCGLQNVSMTSMQRELNKAVSMDQVLDAVKHHLESVFGIKLQTKHLPELQTQIGPT